MPDQFRRSSMVRTYHRFPKCHGLQEDDSEALTLGVTVVNHRPGWQGKNLTPVVKRAQFRVAYFAGK